MDECSGCHGDAKERRRGDRLALGVVELPGDGAGSEGSQEEELGWLEGGNLPGRDD